MKLAIILFLVSFQTWSKPLVLIGYFDPFGRSQVNNSETVASALRKNLQNYPSIQVSFCRLSTVFDKSYAELESCLKGLERRPDLVLGLGESGCNLKIEIMARNRDKTKGADNEGNHRKSSKIIPEGPDVIGFSYPLAQMYCAVAEDERKFIRVSNDAGSFVCNNLAYQMSYFYEELSFGFIHVPVSTCRNLSRINLTVVKNLEQMIFKAVRTSNESRLPSTRKELQTTRRSLQPNSCLSQFYERARGVDEKGRLRF